MSNKCLIKNNTFKTLREYQYFLIFPWSAIFAELNNPNTILKKSFKFIRNVMILSVSDNIFLRTNALNAL